MTLRYPLVPAQLYRRRARGRGPSAVPSNGSTTTWLAVFVALACARGIEPHRIASHPAPPPTNAAPPATSAAPASSDRTLVATQAPSKLSFLEDDYARARNDAVSRGIPIFVDVWASWCHTCMSMKEVVLPDPRLLRLKDAFVWLAIDSENPQNETFLQRFPARSLPTLWVIDPKTEAAQWKWIGAATADELGALLEDARSRNGGQPDGPGDANSKESEATILWVRANQASAAARAEEAVNLYRQALRVGKHDWPRRPKALEALSMRLRELGRTSEALELAVRESATMPPGTSRVNVILNGIDAAAALPPSKSTRAALAALTEIGVRVAEDRAEPILLDDRSGLFLSLVGIFRETNEPESKRLALEWAGLLEEQAKRDPPERRRVWDSHRLEAYLVLGRPERAIPMLEQSEREVPADYNPPARLARAYFTAGRFDEAESAAGRALDRAAGPRKIRIYMLQADILLARKKTPAARAALEAALEFARAAKLPRDYDGLKRAVERRLQSIR